MVCTSGLVRQMVGLGGLWWAGDGGVEAVPGNAPGPAGGEMQDGIALGLGQTGGDGDQVAAGGLRLASWRGSD